MNLEKLVAFIISMAASKNSGGYDILLGSFYSKLTEALGYRLDPPCRSSVCESRQKLKWEAFPYLLGKFNEKIQDDLNDLKWRGHHVYAVDGSCLTLPYSKEIKSSFPDVDAKSLRSHFPKARVVMATHVLSGVPKSMRIGDRYLGERELLCQMLCELEANSILLLDRGYDGVASLKKIRSSGKNFVCRIRSELCSQETVYRFAKSRKKEAVVTLVNQHKESITVRLLKYRKRKGCSPIILATNLISEKRYSRQELWELYSRRWDIETSYYRVKRIFNVESFHSKKLNGVLQEIWSNLLVLGMTSYLILRSWKQKMKSILKSSKSPNFKNASMVLGKYFVHLIFQNIDNTALLKTISREIISVIFIRQFGRHNPRICKKPFNNWRRKSYGKSYTKPKNIVRRGIYA